MEPHIFNVRLFFTSLFRSLSFFVNQHSGLVLFPFKTRIQTFFILTGISLAVYLNTLGHQMAYDDEQVIRKNEFVLQGIRGIPDILTHDSHYSYYGNSGLHNILPGGRYRPLSEISFAVEQQFFSTKHDSVPLQYVWDLNGNHRVDPEEDYDGDHILSDEDFFARGYGFRHFVNILLFALVVGLMYIFSVRYLSVFSADMIFVSCLLFAVLPIHTEVVANIKSRDELFSLLFILLSFIFCFRFLEKGHRFNLFLFSLSFFLALLSKEFAVVFPVLVPAMIYIFNPNFLELKSRQFLLSLFLVVCSVLIPVFLHESLLAVLLSPLVAFIVFKQLRSSRFSALFASMSVPLLIYFTFRFYATKDAGNDLLFQNNIISNPYLPATLEQMWSTKIFVLLKYIFLLIFPVSLSCDYSFNSIPFRDLASWDFWLSVFVYALLFTATLLLFFKRHPLSFPLLIFFAFLSPISNIAINIGATMGERLIFHSSMGFCFLMAWPLHWFRDKISSHNILKFVVSGLIISICLTYFSLTFKRNPDWENNHTLFSSDVKKYPKNVVLLSGVAASLGEKAALEFDTIRRRKMVEESINYVDRALQQAATYTPLFQTLALDFYLLKKYDNSISSCKAGIKVDSGNLVLKNILLTISKECVRNGIESFKRNQSDSALVFFQCAINANKVNPDAWYNKAYALGSKGDTLQALEVLTEAIRVSPSKELLKLKDKLSSKQLPSFSD